MAPCITLVHIIDDSSPLSSMTKEAFEEGVARWCCRVSTLSALPAVLLAGSMPCWPHLGIWFRVEGPLLSDLYMVEALASWLGGSVCGLPAELADGCAARNPRP